MTAPTTLSLNARQWRVLMNDHLEVLKAGVAAAETLDEAGLKEVMRLLDQVRLMASAWYQNSPAAGAGAAGAQPQAEQPVAQQANGAAPKRKGGWPKGVSRKKRLDPNLMAMQS